MPPSRGGGSNWSDRAVPSPVQPSPAQSKPPQIKTPNPYVQPSPNPLKPYHLKLQFQELSKSQQWYFSVSFSCTIIFYELGCYIRRLNESEKLTCHKQTLSVQSYFWIYIYIRLLCSHSIDRYDNLST
jgi:hypothetical protein